MDVAPTVSTPPAAPVDAPPGGRSARRCGPRADEPPNGSMSSCAPCLAPSAVMCAGWPPGFIHPEHGSLPSRAPSRTRSVTRSGAGFLDPRATFPGRPPRAHGAATGCGVGAGNACDGADRIAGHEPSGAGVPRWGRGGSRAIADPHPGWSLPPPLAARSAHRRHRLPRFRTACLHDAPPDDKSAREIHTLVSNVVDDRNDGSAGFEGRRPRRTSPCQPVCGRRAGAFRREVLAAWGNRRSRWGVRLRGHRCAFASPERPLAGSPHRTAETGDAFADLGGEVVFVTYCVGGSVSGWEDWNGRDRGRRVLLDRIGDGPAPRDEDPVFAGPGISCSGCWPDKVEEEGGRRRRRPDRPFGDRGSGHDGDEAGSSWGPCAILSSPMGGKSARPAAHGGEWPPISPGNPSPLPI